jgi:hypothetical protein
MATVSREHCLCAPMVARFPKFGDPQRANVYRPIEELTRWVWDKSR